eukprot:gb/GECG01003295.1/.p1 GENE.gb/GECG01003295.1/~~gb/GECG01003295.1/.p1  ORF type:complete len:185 (+),score=14.95 gb/GECG01003295.1/:1-555(+)
MSQLMQESLFNIHMERASVVGNTDYSQCTYCKMICAGEHEDMYSVQEADEGERLVVLKKPSRARMCTPVYGCFAAPCTQTIDVHNIHKDGSLISAQNNACCSSTVTDATGLSSAELQPAPKHRPDNSYRLVFHLDGGQVYHVDRTYSRKEVETRRLIVAAVNSFIRYWRNEEIEHAGQDAEEHL